mmetsp:Transcript_5218/g.12860  ORF Transcript_5218/g.12860 Transcript_5218/m.12860 type:complete len:220 (+) Transcript_5218:886-1545(+)
MALQTRLLRAVSAQLIACASTWQKSIEQSSHPLVESSIEIFRCISEPYTHTFSTLPAELREAGVQLKCCCIEMFIGRVPEAEDGIPETIHGSGRRRHELFVEVHSAVRRLSIAEGRSDEDGCRLATGAEVHQASSCGLLQVANGALGAMPSSCAGQRMGKALACASLGGIPNNPILRWCYDPKCWNFGVRVLCFGHLHLAAGHLGGTCKRGQLPVALAV